MDHKSRIRLLTQFMDDQGLFALVAFSRATHHVDWADAVTLFCGFKPIDMSMVVLTREGELRLTVSPSWDIERAEQMAMANQISAVSNFQASLAGELAGLGSTGPVGVVDLGMMPHGIAQDVRGLLGADARDVSADVYAATARKTDQEIERAQIATEIAERTFEHLFEIARPGVRACDLAIELKLYAKRLGADDNFMMFHVAPHPSAVQPANCRELQIGDMILAEITPSYCGQFTQVCRTVTVGKSQDQQTDKYELVASAMRSAISKMSPGVPISEIAREVDAVLTAGGYGNYCGPAFMNRRGHGLGLSSIAPGDVSLTNSTVLEAGMLLVVHPNQYIPEVGYLLCGEPVLVTETGFEILTKKRAALAALPV